MGDRMTCPGCNSHTSSVLFAYGEGLPCPYCGLSAEAMSEVISIRSSRANEAVTKRAVAAEIRADKAEREVAALREALSTIDAALTSIRGGDATHE